MDRRLIELHVENFRSLRKVTIPLGPVNVLVGPNGAGKTNVLEVFRFLADVANSDLEKELDRYRYRDVVFRDDMEASPDIRIGLKGAWTSYSQNAPDEYTLELRPVYHDLWYRESFKFKRAKGRGGRRALTLRQGSFTIDNHKAGSEERYSEWVRWAERNDPVPPPAREDEVEPAEFTDRLKALRCVNVDADSVCGDADPMSDLPATLLTLRTDGSAWRQLVDDATQLLPQLTDIDVEHPSSEGVDKVSVVLHERGLRHPTQLSDASRGTVRLLGLLAMLYDPNPPALTCVDGIDRGIHPQALELLVERVREASERTQFLITTHSPTLVDRLKPEELIVCERGDDGASVIPAVPCDRLKAIVAEDQKAPMGGLWFSGALGGDL